VSDFVVVPVKGSHLDAVAAARQMSLIKAQERIAGRAIPFAVLFTQSSPAIAPKTQRHIEGRFAEMAIPTFAARLHDREAYRAIFSVGGTLSGLLGKGVGGLAAAIRNADEFTAELVERLRNGNQAPIQEVAR
jgi:chromosome partitioning protein